MSDVPNLETLKQEAEMRREVGWRKEAAVLSLEWALMVWGWGSKRRGRGRETKDEALKDVSPFEATLKMNFDCLFWRARDSNGRSVRHTSTSGSLPVSSVDHCRTSLPHLCCSFDHPPDNTPLGPGWFSKARLNYLRIHSLAYLKAQAWLCK